MCNIHNLPLLKNQNRCAECQRVYLREWHKKNPGKAAAYNRKYNQKMNGRSQREYEHRNRELQSSRRSEWKRRNFLKVREYSMRRYAWQIASGVKVDYEAVLEKYGMVCHLCGGEIPDQSELHFDHVIPLSRGGTHTEDNLKPAHAFCNYSKNDRLPGEYKARRKR